MYKRQSNLEERTITLSDINENDAGTQIIISDEAGNNYSFFKVKKSDGQPTQAFQDLNVVQKGQQVAVVFEEKPGQNGQVFRNVARIKSLGQAPAQPAQATAPAHQEVYPPAPVSTPRVVSPIYSKSKMIGVLALMKVAGVSLEDLEKAETWERFGHAYDTGESVFSGEVPAPANPPIGEDISVEDIPF